MPEQVQVTSAPSPRRKAPATARMVAVAGTTMAATFAVLETAHRLFFTHSVFA